MSDDIYILAETGADGTPSLLTRELIGLGGALASELGGTQRAVILGDGLKEAAHELSVLGPSEVFTVESPSLSEYNPDLYLNVLRKIFEGRAEGTLLAGHTPVGQDLLPRLAFSLGCGLVTDCIGIEPGQPGGGPVFIKPVFGGNVLASIAVKTPMRMATLRARVGREPRAGGGVAKLIPVEAGGTDAPVTVVERVKEERGMQLEAAPVIVSGGRGMGGPEGFAALSELAGLLGGAVGASRPPVDSGWAPSTCQVGITGKIVAPDLYIAVGISGSSQHLSGMGESGKTVAVNQDPDAYIFKVSDYGVVGDWKQVLPSLSARLKQLLEVE